MARSTSLIALFGAAVLVVAIGAAALRGTDGDADDQPTSAATTAETPTATDATTPDAPTTAPTTEPTATGTASPDATIGPDGTASPDATIEPDATASPDATDGEGVAGEGTQDGGDDGDDEDDGDGVAMGPTDDVQDTPNTGGGALSVLGALLAASAVAAGRRQHG